MKLVWITDIHLNFVSQERAEAFCRAIVDSEADALLIGGDIAEAEDIELWLRFIENRLQRPIYFVLGNHDYYRGSIVQVKSIIQELASRSSWLRWLDREAVIALTDNTGLIGHGGWGDGRCGDYENSHIILNDYILIEELAGLDQETRRKRLAFLGDEAALHFRGSSALLVKWLSRQATIP
jgi:3',5'-cyclic-AMP phosphodiesterase